VSSGQAIQSIWETFGSWTLPSALPSSTSWRPATDVYETQDALIVLMEIPGVSEEDLSVTLFSDLLVIEGTRPQPRLPAMNACHQLGLKYGDFRSEIPLPRAVDHERVTAEFVKGILTVKLMKAE
jgi:HSP20 family protein